MPAHPDYPIPDWLRADGQSRIQGAVRQSPQDFEVTETLGFAPAGSGEHDFLWLEKIGANTAWVAQQLARHAGIPLRDVGYAGLKDRHAVTRQWFSVRRPRGAGTDWDVWESPGVRILEVARHDRKLRRGAHSGNQFRIVVRGVVATVDDIAEKTRSIVERGVPNYFGPQRFGHDGQNMRLACELFAGRRMSRDKRSIAISSARAFLFNHVLQSRVRDDCWCTGLQGETFNLAGTNSIFVTDGITGEINARLRRHDIHPTAALWGRGAPQCSGEAAAREVAVVGEFGQIGSGLDAIGAEHARRPTRLTVQEFSWELRKCDLSLHFSLEQGGFATSVLREMIDEPFCDS
jgi:tRNA pseudouridine13 synthase